MNNFHYDVYRNDVCRNGRQKNAWLPHSKLSEIKKK